MSESHPRTRLETEALILGYAMSRLDAEYLRLRHLDQWQEAFGEAAAALGEPKASFKNLRDEFDPLHDNPRQGWHQRLLRPNRQRVLDELHEVSDDALMELVSRILAKDEEAIVEAVDALAVVTRVPHNVAERLLTGRRAEDFFLQHCKPLIQVDPGDVLDLRLSAQGFDFGVKGRPEWAIEVKGIKQRRGDIQFTDREWIEAKRRRENYWLIVVANMAEVPIPKIVADPYQQLKATSSVQTSVAIVWRSTVSVND
ncbi:MAG: DUF3883 domain-containing protein [Janthinobacterium lividum]